MGERAHIPVSREELEEVIVDLLSACHMQNALIKDMIRFVANMALKDYELFDKAPIEASAAIRRASAIIRMSS